jgi:hypothetical protein
VPTFGFYPLNFAFPSGGVEIASAKHYPCPSERKGAAISKECTRDLPEQSFQDRVLPELGAIRGA